MAYVDTAGKVTTTIGEPPGPAGCQIDVRVGRVSARAIVCDFVELVLGGGSAAEHFAGPAPGTAVRLSRRRQREL